jgi:hypothetical protein
VTVEASKFSGRHLSHLAPFACFGATIFRPGALPKEILATRPYRSTPNALRTWGIPSFFSFTPPVIHTHAHSANPRAREGEGEEGKEVEKLLLYIYLHTQFFLFGSPCFAGKWCSGALIEADLFHG